MSFLVVGSPVISPTSANAKILRRQEYNRESNGLESITETYTIQTSNRITLNPAKGVTHQAFSTASQKYPRMAVETTSFSELDGGISEMTISYVGLTSSSGLPPAIVGIIPATGAGIFGPPVNVEAEFVSDLTEYQIIKGQFSSLSPVAPAAGKDIIRIPQFINGTQMPGNPKEPFVQEGTSSVSSFYYRYEGYVTNNFQCTRRGQFLVCVVTFAEYAASVVGISGGWANRFG